MINYRHCLEKNVFEYTVYSVSGTNVKRVSGENPGHIRSDKNKK